MFQHLPKYFKHLSVFKYLKQCFNIFQSTLNTLLNTLLFLPVLHKLLSKYQYFYSISTEKHIFELCSVGAKLQYSTMSGFCLSFCVVWAFSKKIPGSPLRPPGTPLRPQGTPLMPPGTPLRPPGSPPKAPREAPRDPPKAPRDSPKALRDPLRPSGTSPRPQGTP